MPTTTQISTSAPLNATEANNLLAALRGCALYSLNRQLYPDIGPLVLVHVGVDSNTSRLLSAVHDVVFDSGLSTVAIAGGKDGVNYSAERDREEELTLALDSIIDRPVGATVNGASSQPQQSLNLSNKGVY